VSTERSKYESNVTEQVIVGDNVTMSCKISGTGPVSWLYVHYGTAEQFTVYRDHTVIVEQFKDRLAATSRVSGDHSLLLVKAQLNDSGWYVCVDEDTVVKKYVTALSEFIF
jgi:hypothetical protein